MAVTWVGRDIYCAAADVASLSTNVPANTKAYVDNDKVYRFNGTSWVLFAANDKTETLTGKTISGASNTLSAIPVNSLSNFAVSSPTTNQVLQYNGTNWANATSSSTTEGLGPTWTVYKVGTTYKAISNNPATAPVSGPLLKADVWDNIKNNPTSTSQHIHFLNSSTPYDIEAGVSLELGAINYDYRISGESAFGTKFRPLGNNQVFIFTNTRRFSLDNLGIIVHQGASYTNDAIRTIGTNGGSSFCNFSNLHIRQDIGVSPFTVTQAGRAFVILLTGPDPNVSWVTARNIDIEGFANAVKLATFATSQVNSVPWSNENSFFRVNAHHSKAYFVGPSMLNNEQMCSWHWSHCAWQTTGTAAGMDLTQDHMFDVDVAGTNLGIVRDWHINSCLMWDPYDSNTKYLKANTNSRILIEGGGAEPPNNGGVSSGPLGDQWMGGLGFNAANGTWNTGAYVERVSNTNITRGANSIADGGTISHRLFTTPKHIDVTPSIAGTVAAITAASSTTFMVSLKVSNTGAAAATQTVYWTAREYF